MEHNNDNKFSNGELHKNVQTVGDVVRELSRIDQSMRVKNGFSESVDITIFNQGDDDEHVTFCDGGEWDESVDEKGRPYDQ